MYANNSKKNAPAGNLLVRISRLINSFLHRKSYMLCSFLWIISHKNRVRNSILVTCVALMVYVPSRHAIDIFFRIKRGQKNHCMECFYYELCEEKVIPEDDIEGMQCVVWRNLLLNRKVK